MGTRGRTRKAVDVVGRQLMDGHAMSLHIFTAGITGKTIKICGGQWNTRFLAFGTFEFADFAGGGRFVGSYELSTVVDQNGDTRDTIAVIEMNRPEHRLPDKWLCRDYTFQRRNLIRVRLDHGHMGGARLFGRRLRHGGRRRSHRSGDRLVDGRIQGAMA